MGITQPKIEIVVDGARRSLELMECMQDALLRTQLRADLATWRREQHLVELGVIDLGGEAG